MRKGETQIRKLLEEQGLEELGAARIIEGDALLPCSKTAPATT